MSKEKRVHSIARKILMAVAVTLLISWACVLALSFAQIKAIIDADQVQIFNEKLDVVMSLLTHADNQQLQAETSITSLEKTQQDVIAFLNDKFYEKNKTHSPEIYPFILDAQGHVITHPVLPKGDTSVQSLDFIKRLLAPKNGFQDYVYLSQKKWMVFKTFEPWQWSIGYVIPWEVKYAQVKTLMLSHLLIMILTVISVLGVMVVFLKRVVSRRINATVEMVKKVANGDLTQTLPIDGHDEISRMASHFNMMVANLKLVLTHITDIALQINDHGLEVREISLTQSSGAQQQSEAVSATANAATQLSSTSEEIGQHIQAISQKANHVLTGMDNIKALSDQTNQVLTSLSDKSRQIGKITELIDDVADQTNLLAVNASIDAARAGEQGRGFTVVADQISKLADSTAKSTKDITALVEMIQHEMGNATLAMEESLGSVEEEIKLAQDSADTSQAIAMRANQQINGSQQIAEAMKGIDHTMHNITTSAESSTQAAAELTSLADQLKQSVNHFKIA